MGQTNYIPAKASIQTQRAKYLVMSDILNFNETILSDPVLIHRFMEVKEDVILSLANKMLDLLRLS